LIDNSPTDKLKYILHEFKNLNIEYVYGQGNVGYGAGHNIAIKQSINENAKYHIVLNPDIFFNSDTIIVLSNFMDKNPEVGQILPEVKYPNGELQYLCKLLPTPIDIFGRKLLPKRLMHKRNMKYEMHETGYNKIRNCPTLSGCFMFLRVSVLQKIGGFDERFFMYFEDNDLTRRIHQVSKTVYYPFVSIIHNHAAEHRTNKTLLKAGIKSAIQYFNKWGWIFDIERRNINRDAFSKQHIIENIE